MRVSVATAVALVAHVGALAWLVPRAPRVVVWAAPDVAPAAAAPPKEDPIVAVVLLDEPRAAAVAAAAAAPRHVARASNPRTARAVSIEATAPASAAPEAAPAADVAPVAAPRPAHDYFAMRPPDLSASQLDLPARAGGAPALPPPVLPPAEMQPSGHGTYSTDLGGSDWRTRTATAHVARDGTVHFDNAPDVDIHFAGIGLAGKMNVDDWLARRHGHDPYAAAKKAYLERTFEARARLAELNRADDLAHAAEAMQRNVDAARAIADLAARKEALFELWDEVAETGDEALVHAGEAARAYLVGAIRAMRPTVAFTPDELAQLNARRRSRAVFAPY